MRRVLTIIAIVVGVWILWSVLAGLLGIPVGSAITVAILALGYWRLRL